MYVKLSDFDRAFWVLNFSFIPFFFGRPASSMAKEAVLEGKVQRVQEIIADMENHM